jgi:transcriptional regulator with XRE-family HTH domain
MSPSYSKWRDVKAQGRALDPRTAEEQAAGKATARERTEAYVRGHQLAEMRTAAGVTQAELADALGVSQARISKIEHGEISGIDVVRAYVIALGGTIDVVARLGDRSWKVALPRRVILCLAVLGDHSFWVEREAEFTIGGSGILRVRHSGEC